jgi:hypothetical protein
MISFKSPRRESSFEGANSKFLASHRHPCKSLSTEKHEFPVRALESALLVRSGAAAAHVCLSADGSCTLQNRTSICCLRLQGAVAED